MVLKIKGEKLGGHVHAYVYSGPSSEKLALCGKLTFREAEYPDFLAGMRTRDTPGFKVLIEGDLS